jgi:type II secretory pathway pseudopilin PulG
MILKKEEKHLYKQKKEKAEMGFTLNELLIVIFIFGALGAVAIPKYLNLSAQNSLNEARLVCGSLRDTIDGLHSDYLIDGKDYNAEAVIGSTLLAGGVAVTNKLNSLTYVSRSRNFSWTYVPRNGVWPAYLTEDSSSAFP